jgi:hypothetical protein
MSLTSALAPRVIVSGAGGTAGSQLLALIDSSYASLGFKRRRHSLLIVGGSMMKGRDKAEAVTVATPATILES